MAALSVSEVSAYLNLSADKHADELSSIIAAAEAAIASHVGPLEPVTVTARVSGVGTLMLPVYPVISLTSITSIADPTPLVVSDFQVDMHSGLVSYVSGLSFVAGQHTVVYQAGRTTLPADLRLAVLELVRHFWQTQRNPAQFPGAAISDGPSSAPNAGYLMPYRVQELLAPHEQYSVA